MRSWLATDGTGPRCASLDSLPPHCAVSSTLWATGQPDRGCFARRGETSPRWSSSRCRWLLASAPGAHGRHSAYALFVRNPTRRGSCVLASQNTSGRVATSGRVCPRLLHASPAPRRARHAVLCVRDPVAAGSGDAGAGKPVAVTPRPPGAARTRCPLTNFTTLPASAPPRRPSA